MKKGRKVPRISRVFVTGRVEKWRVHLGSSIGGSRHEIGEIFVSDYRKSVQKRAIFWSSYYTQKSGISVHASRFQQNAVREAVDCRILHFHRRKPSPEAYFDLWRGLTGQFIREICLSEGAQIGRFAPQGQRILAIRRGSHRQFIREITCAGRGHRAVYTRNHRCGDPGRPLRRVVQDPPPAPKCRKSGKKCGG